MPRTPKYCFTCYKLIGNSRGWTAISVASTGLITDAVCYRCDIK